MKVVQLGDVCKVVSGSTPKREIAEYWNGTIPWVTPKEISRLPSRFLSESAEKISEAGFRSCSTEMLPAGSLLLSSRAPIGLLAINKIPVCTNQGFKSLVPGNDVNVEYLYFVLKANVSNLQAKGNGATFKELAKPAVENFQIPLPPLDDQIRIAYLLGKVEGLIAQRKQQLQQLDDLLKSVFLEMFGDPISNPRQFPVRRLSEFYVNAKEGTKCGPFGSALKKDELVNSGVPVWNMDNIGPGGQMVAPFRMWITREKYKELAAYSVQDGDIVISRAGTVGKMCIAQMHGQSAIISTNLIRLRLGSNLRPLHFVSLMLYCKGRVGRLKVGADGAFTHMNTGILDSLEFPYPPIELQDRFGAIASQVQGIKTRYQQSLTDLETLYGALSQQAFKGELDLSRVPLPTSADQETPPAAIDLVPPLAEASETPNLEADQLLSVLKDAPSLEEIMHRWLEIWLGHLREAPFSVDDFTAYVQTRLEKLQPDTDFVVGQSHYEHVKTWVFEALSDGRLKQSYDDAGNRILLKAAHP